MSLVYIVTLLKSRSVCEYHHFNYTKNTLAYRKNRLYYKTFMWFISHVADTVCTAVVKYRHKLQKKSLENSSV